LYSSYSCFDVGAIYNTGDYIKGDAIGAARSQFMVDNSEGKRHSGRTRRRKADNIKMYLKETGREDVDWINLSQIRTRGRFF
jgi:hypothetical protein